MTSLAGTILVASVPTAITAGALIFQSIRADRREERRQEREREQREDTAREAREQDELRYKREMAERWRDDRMRAHTDLFSAFDVAYGAMTYPILDARYSKKPLGPVPKLEEGVDAIPEEISEQLERALSVVRIVASKATVWAANIAASELHNIEVALDCQIGTAGQVAKHSEAYEAARNDYRECVRRELGVED